MILIPNILQTYDCQNKICETQVLLLDFRLLQVQRRLSVGRRVSWVNKYKYLSSQRNIFINIMIISLNFDNTFYVSWNLFANLVRSLYLHSLNACSLHLANAFTLYLYLRNNWLGNDTLMCCWQQYCALQFSGHTFLLY